MRPASSAVLISRPNTCCWAAARGQGAGEPLPSLARGRGVHPQTDRAAHGAGRESVDLGGSAAQPRMQTRAGVKHPAELTVSLASEIRTTPESARQCGFAAAIWN